MYEHIWYEMVSIVTDLQTESWSKNHKIHKMDKII
jgi:hypothetical protein